MQPAPDPDKIGSITALVALAMPRLQDILCAVVEEGELDEVLHLGNAEQEGFGVGLRHPTAAAAPEHEHAQILEVPTTRC